MSPLSSFSGTAGVLRRANQILIQTLLLILTALQFVALLFPAQAPVLGDIAAVLVAIFLPPAFLRARLATRALFGILGAAVVAAAGMTGSLAPVWRGLHNAMLLGAFLSVLQLLRAVAHGGPAILAVRGRLARLRPREVEGGFAVGAFGLGSFLSFGAHAVLAPLLPADTPAADKRAAALASVRGICFTAFWSPFFVGVAYVTHQMHQADSGLVILTGLALSLLALGTDLALGRTGPVSLGRIIYALLPLVPLGVAIAAVFLGIMGLTGISAMGAVVVGVPFVAAGLLFFHGVRQAPRVLKTALTGLVYGSDELLLVAAANVFAAVLTEVPGFAATVAPFLAGLPPLPLLVAVFAVMLVAGACGFHPAISAAVLLGIFAGQPPSVEPLCLAVALVMGWSLAVTVSPVGVTMMVAAQMFSVPFPRLLFSRNLVGTVVVAVVAAGLLAMLDGLLKVAG